ncbi:MAG: M1 family metallopeptidase, partial [Candidatus Acidiferrales bacterium]
WKMDDPVALVTFALGPFERHEEVVKERDLAVPVEFHSLSGNAMPIKEDFIVAEMMNSVNYFSAIFGKYPYPRLSAVFHPFGFGQGFATLLLIPNTDRSSKYTYSFLAHETAHQWWGNIVAWRSYRDQWLSEGFAEYSGVLYTGLRDKPKAARELLEDMRRSLKDPPVTETGIGKGKLAEVGPIILGHRLSTRETQGAYQTLIYNKGGLVLRMLHFLFTDPASGNGDAFFKMMADFVKRNQGGSATTEGFIQVANEHFARTPIAQKYKLQDLNWFFRQWVYQAHLPSYRLEYSVQGQPDGSVMVQGTVLQENTPADWFMPLPLVFEFDKNQRASGTIHAYGPKTPFQIKLPMKPKKVELDPALWIISEKTSTSGK